MGASLRDLPLIDHNDLIGVLDGVEAVGDHQGSAASD